MTTVVWDGRTLAVDRLSRLDDVRCEVAKLRVDPEVGAIAAAGNHVGDAQALRNLREIAAGERTTLDFDAFALIALNDGRVLQAAQAFEAYPLEEPTAIGCGAEAGQCLLRAGVDAREAVRIVGEVTVHTGLGVDSWNRPDG